MGGIIARARWEGRAGGSFGEGGRTEPDIALKLVGILKRGGYFKEEKSEARLVVSNLKLHSLWHIINV